MIVVHPDSGDTAALMLGEAMHRYSNSLQIIVSMTNQILRSDVRDAHVREGLYSLQERVSLFAAISRSLSGPFGPEMATMVAIHRLCTDLAACFDRHDTEVCVAVEGGIETPDDCRIAVLLIAELMTNALKHGCAARPLSIRLDLLTRDAGSRLVFHSNTPPRHATVRPRIAAGLAEAVGGSLISVGNDSGFEVEAWIPRRRS